MHCKLFDSYGEAFGKMDVIGCLLDLDRGEVSFTKDDAMTGVQDRLCEAEGILLPVESRSTLAKRILGTRFRKDTWRFANSRMTTYMALNLDTGSESAVEDSSCLRLRRLQSSGNGSL